MHDMRTREGALAWAEECLQDARDEWTVRARDGAGLFPARAFLLAMVDPRTGLRQKEPLVVGVLAPQEGFDMRTRESFAEILRSLSIRLGAIGTLFVAEAWTVQSEDPAEDLGAKSLANDPRRREVIWARLEHRRAGEKVWMAPIVRPEAGPPSVGDFELLPDVESSEGRFSRTLAERNLS